MMLPLVGLVSLILFGYGFYLYFIKQKELLEGIIFSFALGTGIVCFIIFMLNGVIGLPINYASNRSPKDESHLDS